MPAIQRSDFRDAVETLLEQQRAATPGLLRKTSRHHPGGMGGEKPIAWQGEIADVLAYDAGTRERTMTEDVQVATTFSADLPTDDFDDLMDAILERFTANYGIIPNTILELLAITPSDVANPRPDGNADIYRGSLLSIRLRIWEGRI